MYRNSFLLAAFSLLLVSIHVAGSPSTVHVDSTTPSIRSAGVGCESRCCTGRNNVCHSTGLRLNGKGAPYARCFCDEGCLDIGDCCFDYREHCKAVDCKVSDWGEYSSCSKECGLGIKTRERVIIVEPRFGGEACPSNLKETTVCSNVCNETQIEDKQKQIETETARIMPARYGKFRSMKQYNADMDIRKNLYNRYYRNSTQKYTGYCSRFRVVSSRSACVKSYIFPWANVLDREAVVCVECQQTAMENGKGMCAGHGKVETNTHWNAVTAQGCSGWWQRLEDDQQCNCDEDHSFIYI